MLDVSSSKLVSYLNHPNGWWRDNAQKSLVLRNDKSIVPQLETLVKTSTNPLAKIHALWTLNGMHSLTKELLVDTYKDADAQVRKTAVWASEYFMDLKNNSFVLSKLDALKTDPSADVRFQLALSLRFNDYMLKKYPNNDILVTSVKTYQESVATEKERIAKEKSMNQATQLVMEEGASIYNSFCNVCHGVDGKGILSPNGELPAPILANNKNVSSNPTKLIKVLLRGLNGPIDGKTYTPGLMPALQDNDDKYIASVLSYIRNNFGNKGKMVTEQDVAKIRTETANRTQPYTVEELNVSDAKRK
jgi:mono/diheme cytochrome c family protein